MRGKRTIKLTSAHAKVKQRLIKKIQKGRLVHVSSLTFAKHHWRYAHKQKDRHRFPQKTCHGCLHVSIVQVFPRTCVYQRASRMSITCEPARTLHLCTVQYEREVLNFLDLVNNSASGANKIPRRSKIPKSSLLNYRYR